MRKANLILPKSLKEIPLSLVEIGGRGSPPYRWNRVRSHVDLVSVEPDPQEAAQLNKTLQSLGYRSAHFLPIALGSKRGSISLHLAKNRMCSSVLPPNLQFLSRFPDSEKFRTERLSDEVAVARLDEELPKLGMDRCDFLRCDVEGYEYEIFEGAGSLLKTTLGVEVEVSMQERYRGQHLFYEVATKLRENGLILAHLERKWWLRKCAPEKISSIGQDVFADCLFVRDPLKAEGIDRAQMLKTALILLLYDHLDWALESFEHGHHLGLVTADEVLEMRAWLEKYSLQRSLFWRIVASLPKFPFRLRLARAMGLASDILMGRIYGSHFRSDGTAWNRSWDWTRW